MPHRSRRGTFAALLTVAMSLALAVPASAEKDDEPEPGLYEQNGLYLVATATYAFPLERGNLVDGAADRRLVTPGNGIKGNVDNSFGYGGRLGYRLHPRVALEGQFELLNNIEIDVQDAAGVESKDELQAYSVTGNAKGYFATGRFQPYAIAGAGWMRTRLKPDVTSTQHHNGFTARFGGGIDIYGSPDVALTLESTYVLATGGTADLDNISLSAGLMLRFYPLE